MARKFLYIIAGLVVLALVGLIGLRIFAGDLTRMAFVPDAEFTEQPPVAANAYAGMDLWIARPGMGNADPSRWMPEGVEEDADAIGAAVFFVHPTSYVEKAYWNAPVDEPKSRERANVFVRGMASPFNKSVDVWAPRYRQAAFGAFLSDEPAAQKALAIAYGDVSQAFDQFIATVDPERPVVLVGHSQGALMVMQLLRDKVAGTPLASRIAAAYVIGWPVSMAHDLPKMGLPACERADQPGCIVSYSSWGEPADPPAVEDGIPATVALDGESRFSGPILCVDPLTGTRGGEAPASANLGTLFPAEDLANGELRAGEVPARCDGDTGMLLIGEPPEMGQFVLPGNNYHVYDITLFWRNLRQDFSHRVTAWQAAAR
jgi:hypothetical protein